MNGCELRSRVQAQFPHLYIIVMSAWTALTDKTWAYGLGAADDLTNSFRVLILQERLRLGELRVSR